MKYSAFLTCLILITLTPSALAQSSDNSIRGELKDQDGKPLSEVIVSLLKARDLSLYKTTFSEADGRFEFSALPSDSFRLLMQQPGLKKYLGPTLHPGATEQTMNLPTIQLEAEGKKLDEVVVTSQIPFVERKADRTIVNPDALISNAGGNALDVLAKAPGVTVDEQGNIKLKGKAGVMILIDDKPTYLSAAELESYLKSLPSSTIKQIEIMTNPPAHYEAAGGSGIINIKTKKNKLPGINGNVSTNYSQGRYARTMNSLALNYSNKRLTVFSNLSYGYHNSFHDLTIDRKYKKDDNESIKSIFSQNTYIHPESSFYNARLGMDYYLSDKTTIGISGKGMYDQSLTSSYNYASLLDSTGSLSSNVIADNTEKGKLQNNLLNLNFRHQFDSAGKTLTVDLDYVSYVNRIDQFYKNDVYTPDGSNAYTDIQNGGLPSTINIYAFKTDYTNPLKGNGKFDAGLKTSYTQTDNDAVYTITRNGLTENNYNLSNHFKYDEMINAAYVNFSKSLKRFDLQAGLRFESTTLNGYQLGNAMKPASDFTRNYNNLFPTLYASYRIDSASNHVLNLSYGRRINRPYYHDLNPFSRPLDRYTFYEGNPYLKPTFTHNVSLAYSFKNFFTITATYNNLRDQIQETIEINNGIYYSRPGNIGTSVHYNLSLESSIPVTKWLTTTIYTETQYAEYKSQLYTQTLNSSGTYWYINGSNSFSLKKGWSAELSGEYITNFIDSQFSFGDYGHITVGLQKKILKSMGSLRFSLSDVLYTNRIRGRINNLYLTDANWYGPRDTRVASFTFSYRFGKSTNNKPKHTGSGSETEQGRIK
jgi:hypothetical protein